MMTMYTGCTQVLPKRNQLLKYFTFISNRLVVFFMRMCVSRTNKDVLEMMHSHSLPLCRTMKI